MEENGNLPSTSSTAIRLIGISIGHTPALISDPLPQKTRLRPLAPTSGPKIEIESRCPVGGTPTASVRGVLMVSLRHSFHSAPRESFDSLRDSDPPAYSYAESIQGRVPRLWTSRCTRRPSLYLSLHFSITSGTPVPIIPPFEPSPPQPGRPQQVSSNMLDAANWKLQKTQTAGNIKAASGSDPNEAHAMAKAQSTKANIPVRPVGARDIKASTPHPLQMHTCAN